MNARLIDTVSMTHELVKIFEGYEIAHKEGLSCVLATVVDLDGSSYRRAGVRMLIMESGQMIGAVSGGCVEKEVVRQAEEVFSTGNAKMMTYDGRYRLGCEGVLYILIEPFHPENVLKALLSECLTKRDTFEITSFYSREVGINDQSGSVISFKEKAYSVSGKKELANDQTLTFSQKMNPCFRLLIIGAEHDAVQLCQVAAFTGWDVVVGCSAKDPKQLSDFPGSKAVTPLSDDLSEIKIDSETAVVLMTHNFARDLNYLIALKDVFKGYIGLLGSYDRREKMITHLIEKFPDIDMDFLDNIHGPSGLDIGAETPQEIAISIISEVLAFTRKSTPMKLRVKTGRIHS